VSDQDQFIQSGKGVFNQGAVHLIEPDRMIAEHLASAVQKAVDVEFIISASLPPVGDTARKSGFAAIILDPANLGDPLFDAAHLLDDPRQRCILYSSIEETRLALVRTRPGVVEIINRRDGEAPLVGSVMRALACVHGRDGNGLSGAQPAGKSVSLSKRERETLAFLGRGYTLKEVATRLNINPKTVETYKSRATAKLGISSRSELVNLVAYGQFPGT